MDPTIPALDTELIPITGLKKPPCNVQTLILTVLTWITSLVGLTGNAVVLWLLGLRVRRNAFSTYILNLAAADLLFLSSRAIYSLLRFINIIHPISKFLYPMIMLSYFTGLSLLSAISTERCVSVLWPIWYRCRRPAHLSAVVCALLWALSLLRSILEWMLCGFLFSDADSALCQTSDFITVAWLIFLFVILCGSSLVLLVRILCGSRKMPLTRLYVTILLTVLVFLLCGLPLGIHNANPIIYFFVGFCRQRQNWKTLKLVLQRALQDTPEVDEGGRRLPEKTLELSGSRLGSERQPLPCQSDGT
uniref:G-protein coupled receptors family 1 profile domain-containing protein n=1 Tax=Saimiri boliviensis boliviensis TaxID=39432 RepID=A0A2K6T1A1_SAIBB